MHPNHTETSKKNKKQMAKIFLFQISSEEPNHLWVKQNTQSDWRKVRFKDPRNSNINILNIKSRSYIPYTDPILPTYSKASNLHGLTRYMPPIERFASTPTPPPPPDTPPKTRLFSTKNELPAPSESFWNKEEIR